MLPQPNPSSHSCHHSPGIQKPHQSPLLARGVLVCSPTRGHEKLESTCCLCSTAGAGVWSTGRPGRSAALSHPPASGTLTGTSSCHLPPSVEERGLDHCGQAFASRVWTDENAQHKCVICVSSRDSTESRGGLSVAQGTILKRSERSQDIWELLAEKTIQLTPRDVCRSLKTDTAH